MMEAMGLPRSQRWKGYQMQHVIPSEVRSHPVLRKIGMDLDNASNGMFLPTPKGKSISPLSRHDGYHSIYNKIAKRQLDRMDLSTSVSELEMEVLSCSRS